MSNRSRNDRQQGRPEDRSSGDLRSLRDQTRQSAEARQSLADDIRLDQALYATLGSSPLTTSQIVAHARQGAPSGVSGALGSIASWLAPLAVTILLPLIVMAMLPSPSVRPGDIPAASEPSAGDDALEQPDPRFFDDDTSPSDRFETPPPREGDADIDAKVGFLDNGRVLEKASPHRPATMVRA